MKCAHSIRILVCLVIFVNSTVTRRLESVWDIMSVSFPLRFVKEYPMSTELCKRTLYRREENFEMTGFGAGQEYTKTSTSL